MKGAGVCVRGRERSHALKGWLFGCVWLEWNVSGWVLQYSTGASGTIRTARVRVGRAAVVIARARQYRTPRQGFPACYRPLPGRIAHGHSVQNDSQHNPDVISYFEST